MVRPRPENEPISPLNPDSMPRAEDDEQTFARSAEFHDRPDPGPNVGRRPDVVGDWISDADTQPSSGQEAER